MNLQTNNATVRGSLNNPIEGSNNKRDEGTSDGSNGKRWQQEEVVAVGGSGGSSGTNNKREPPTSENPRQRGSAVEGKAAVRWKEGSAMASDGRKGRSHQATTLMLPRATARALGGHYRRTKLARGGPTTAWQFERSGER